MNNIRNYNEKGETHGYQEWYVNGKISLRTKYKNGKFIGYQEWHNKQTNFYIR
jgi:hypothetical protein